MAKQSEAMIPAIKSVTLEDVLKEVVALRADIKMLKMNLLQINQMKQTGGMRV